MTTASRLSRAATEIILPPLHPAQYEVVQHPARFKVLCCGRRWGKTFLGAELQLECALSGGVGWWVAPTYAISQIAWRMILNLARQMGSTFRIRESDMALECKVGGRVGRVQIKTGNDPNLLRGEGLDLAVMDEAAYLHSDVWDGAIQPALSDREGAAVFISTPCGLNQFFKLFGMGQDPANLDWKSWRFPTASNPYIKPAEIARAQKTMPERHFREEYMAEFMDDSHGLVFRGVSLVSTAEKIHDPADGARYVAGLDWGRDNDFTALSIWDSEARTEVELIRFRDISWTVQRDKIKRAMEHFHVVTCIAEANSIGSPNIEALIEDDLPIQAFYSTVDTKAEVIDALALGIEQLDLTLLNDENGTHELKAYEMRRLPSGKFHYGAPDGGHDDTVIARALGFHALRMGFSGVRWI